MSICCAMFIEHCSREHNVADLFADRCVRVESSGVHHEVILDVRVFDSSLYECHFVGPASCVPVLGSYIWTRRSSVSSEPRVSSVKVYDKICKSNDA